MAYRAFSSTQRRPRQSPADFPDLRPEDFAPWVNPDEAQTGAAPADFAAQQAEPWRRSGPLGAGRRTDRRLREAADCASTRPAAMRLAVSILNSSPRQRSHSGRQRTLRGASRTTVSGLLGLVNAAVTRPGAGKPSSGERDSTRLAGGRDLDLGALIRNSDTERPAYRRDDVGIPPSGSLATAINGLVTSPGRAWPKASRSTFSAFTIRPQAARGYLFHRPPQRCRADAATLLLNQILGWRAHSRHDQPARPCVHGRNIRLLPAGGESALEIPQVDSANMGALGTALFRATQNPVTSTTRSRHRHLVLGRCKPTGTSSVCSTASRAPRPSRAPDAIALLWSKPWPPWGTACFSSITCTKKALLSSNRAGPCPICAAP
jgi:hypothetical protein